PGRWGVVATARPRGRGGAQPAGGGGGHGHQRPLPGGEPRGPLPAGLPPEGRRPLPRAQPARRGRSAPGRGGRGPGTGGVTPHFELFPLGEYWWFYAAFTAFVCVLLSIDLGVFHRRAHTVSMKEAATWTAVWVALAMAFMGGFHLFIRHRLANDP